MAADLCAQRSLFGGAIVSTFPIRFEDVSNVRQVPDHQEAFVDPTRDESLMFELLDLKTDVVDHGSATWFLQDLANEQDAEGAMERTSLKSGWEGKYLMRALFALMRAILRLLEDVIAYRVSIPFRCLSSLKFFRLMDYGLGTILAISKGRQGRDAQNIVKRVFFQVYLANLRLKDVTTDVLIIAYEPMLINPLSESAATVGAGLAVPAAQTGRMPMSEVFKNAVQSFKVNDWSLFGAAV
ncbi:Ran guanine nucleotide release factor [Striga asiatica]|uniref:Ran guanine nucleotide release factor n=1 Tax=Striga asiatica TaxID=4170 RepID=A0A5A7QVX5_STRAF|nr:Ran guanine nucleotide release factor [Striga asiatica]